MPLKMCIPVEEPDIPESWPASIETASPIGAAARAALENMEAISVSFIGLVSRLNPGLTARAGNANAET
jgi:hypothetical protein